MENNITGKPFLENLVIDALRNVFDPEIPVNIYDLGLIYKIVAPIDGNVSVIMTLTSPNCPVAESLPGEVRNEILKVRGVNSVTVELVFDPPWEPEMMSESAKLDLGML